jgi:hypothetical protein
MSKISSKDEMLNLALEVEYYDAPILYKSIEEGDLAGAIGRLKTNPGEASVWIYRTYVNCCDEMMSQYDPLPPLQWRILPIHAACIFGSSAEVVYALIESDPRTVNAFDLSGKLPLHLACHLCISTDVVRTLLKASPHSVYEPDSVGNQPIDLAIDSNGPERAAVLCTLLEGISSVMKISRNDPIKMNMLREMRSKVLKSKRNRKILYQH